MAKFTASNHKKMYVDGKIVHVFLIRIDFDKYRSGYDSAIIIMSRIFNFKRIISNLVLHFSTYLSSTYLMQNYFKSSSEISNKN